MARLPPFFALRALEAAARHRSYSRAAQELAVTHGAVSQQIRRLEAELGARLFERKANAMLPTPEAARLAQAVGRALAQLQNAVDDFTAAAERDPLVASLDPQFAARWLPQRLQRLLTHPAGANLELRVEERQADFVRDGVDMAVRYGAGRWPGVEAALLFRETLIPVASPAFAAAHPVSAPQDLLNIPLLHHQHRPWSLWFAAIGETGPTPTGLRFEDSTLLLESAAQGLGAALGRSGLLEQDLKSGRLVPLIGQSVASDLGFYVVWRGDSRKLQRIIALREWLAAEVAQNGQSDPA